MKVAVLGASTKPDRYSNKAIRLLKDQGHEVVPVNPAYDEIEGMPVMKTLEEAIPGDIHTLTMYVGPDRSDALADAIRFARPERVIFNPGAENPVLAETLAREGIETLEACTLVLLNTGQF